MLKLGVIKTRLRFSPGLISYITLALSLLVFLLWRLGSLTAGLSPSEANSRAASNNLHGLLSNPINAPYHLLQHLLIMVNSGAFSLRFISFIFGIAIAVCFYLYMKSLFGRIIGLLGSLSLISLPLFVILARAASPQILLFSPIVLMYLAFLLTRPQPKYFIWPMLALVIGLSLYTPGILWWVAGATILSYKKMSEAIRTLPTMVNSIGLGVLGLGITPLVVIGGLHLSSLKQLLAIPARLPAPAHFGAELLRMLGALFVRSPGDSQLLLGNLPVLNITLSALVIFGGYALFTAARGKAISMSLSIVLAIVLAALNEDVVYLALAVPALAILATAGLRYLYIEWRGIFPRNPVPKTFALILIAAVTLAQVYYAANYSLEAWPHSPPIRKAYVLK